MWSVLWYICIMDFEGLFVFVIKYYLFNSNFLIKINKWCEIVDEKLINGLLFLNFIGVIFREKVGLNIWREVVS